MAKERLSGDNLQRAEIGASCVAGMLGRLGLGWPSNLPAWSRRQELRDEQEVWSQAKFETSRLPTSCSCVLPMVDAGLARDDFLWRAGWARVARGEAF